MLVISKFSISQYSWFFRNMVSATVPPPLMTGFKSHRNVYDSGDKTVTDLANIAQLRARNLQSSGYGYSLCRTGYSELLRGFHAAEDCANTSWRYRFH